MPIDDPTIRAAIEAHARALEACILAQRMRAVGCTGAHRALVDGARARKATAAPQARDLKRLHG